MPIVLKFVAVEVDCCGVRAPVWVTDMDLHARQPLAGVLVDAWTLLASPEACVCYLSMPRRARGAGYRVAARQLNALDS